MGAQIDFLENEDMANGKRKSPEEEEMSALDLLKDALDIPEGKNKPSTAVRRPASRTASSSSRTKATKPVKQKEKPSVKGKKRRVTPSEGRKGKYWWINPRNWSSGMIWTIIGVIAACYVFFFYFFFVGPYSFRWKAYYGDINYPEGYEIHGIDISHYQGSIDWEKVRNASIKDCPVRFVFIKATEGTNLMDDYFNENFYQAKENGFIRGAYHFFSPLSPGKEQARYFLRQVHLEDGDLPPVLDIETVGNLTPTQIKKEVLDWLNVVESRYGVKPIIYTYYKFKMEYLSDEIFDPYPYWIAHYYVEQVKYQGEWRFWQYTDLGRIPGIRENVDLNIYNGSMYDLLKFTIGSSVEQPLHD